MRIAMIVTAALLLGGCPYRTRIYTGDEATWMKIEDGTVKFGKEMQLAKAQAQVIDLGTLAQDCESGVIAFIDEIRTIGGLNIFTGSRRSLEVVCAIVE